MRGRGMETQREQHMGSGAWAHRHIGGYNTNEEKFPKWSKARIPRVERWRKSRLHIETASWGCHRCLRCQWDAVLPSNSHRAGIRAVPALPQSWPADFRFTMGLFLWKTNDPTFDCHLHTWPNQWLCNLCPKGNFIICKQKMFRGGGNKNMCKCTCACVLFMSTLYIGLGKCFSVDGALQCVVIFLK